MNKHLLLLLISVFASLNVLAKKDSLYVGLKDGRIIPAKTLEMKSPFLAGSYLLVNGTEKYKANTVRFYRDFDGYFLNTVTSNNSKEQFYRREFEGKLSLYSKITTSYQPNFGVGGGGFGNPGFGGGAVYGGTYRTNKVEYIQRGAENKLITLNYNNLYNETKDNEDCKVVLKQIKNLRTFSTLGYSGGAALFIAGLVHTVSKNEQKGLPPYPDTSIKFSPLLFVGAAVAIIPAFTIGNKRKKMLNVISIYNQ